TDIVESARQRVDDPDRPAVRHHEHGLVGMADEDLVEEAPDACREVRERLRVVRARAVAGQPERMRVAELHLNLRPRLTLPCTKPPLTQPLVDVNLEPEPAGRDLRSLAGAGQVARIDNVDAVELSRETCRLLTAELVQPRVGVSLPAAVAIPVGF